MSIRSGLSAVLLALLAACHAETFTATGPSGFELVQGPPEAVSLMTWLDSAVTVRVVDQTGRPVEGVEVEWAVTEGDGAVDPLTSMTDADGIARVEWRFDRVPGPQVLQAKASGVEPFAIATEAHAFRGIQVTAGYGHGCALDAAHEAWCFGGTQEENGGPDVIDGYRPVKVGGGHQFAEIQAGDSFTCGRTASGEVWCWGYNWSGALGTPGAGHSALPLRVTGLPPATLLRTGAMHACTIATDSTTWCWGSISDGGPDPNPGTAPTQLASPLKFVDLAPGMAHTCGLLSTGTVYCWGRNAEHQLGDSGLSRALPTTPILGGHQFVELRSGDNSSCGRTPEGEVWCWGLDWVRPLTTIGPIRLDFPPAYGLTMAFSFTAVGTLGGNVQFAMPPGWAHTLPTSIQTQGIAAIEGRGSYCMLTRTGDVYCSGSVVDGGSCSAIPPAGCTSDGPVPLPTGGRAVVPWETVPDHP
jgi:hypothetical protein